MDRFAAPVATTIGPTVVRVRIGRGLPLPIKNRLSRIVNAFAREYVPVLIKTYDRTGTRLRARSSVVHGDVGPHSDVAEPPASTCAISVESAHVPVAAHTPLAHWSCAVQRPQVPPPQTGVAAGQSA